MKIKKTIQQMVREMLTTSPEKIPGKVSKN